MQIIYLDILLLESFYVNYFLLRATGRLTHTRLRICRCVFAAVVSSLFSLLLFLPLLPIVVQWLLKLGTAGVTVFLAFGRSHARFVRFRQILCFFAVVFSWLDCFSQCPVKRNRGLLHGRMAIGM
ncbi:MAG: sigma-E processing peptidase SpoIIGA [Ruminococcus sp.]|nr:sigma-E processing peptidase SpoIIGA [Ruminococcus sp.]